MTLFSFFAPVISVTANLSFSCAILPAAVPQNYLFKDYLSNIIFIVVLDDVKVLEGRRYELLFTFLMLLWAPCGRQLSSCGLQEVLALIVTRRVHPVWRCCALVKAQLSCLACCLQSISGFSDSKHLIFLNHKLLMKQESAASFILSQKFEQMLFPFRLRASL